MTFGECKMIALQKMSALSVNLSPSSEKSTPRSMLVTRSGPIFWLGTPARTRPLTSRSSCSM